MKPAATREELAIRVAVLGKVGPAAQDSVGAAVTNAWGGGRVLHLVTSRIGDDSSALRESIRRWCDRDGVDVILTVGRSGHRAGDFAPDVTAPLLGRTLPGVEERMYLASPRRPEDLLFRGRAGIRGNTIVINLPDRPARIRAIAAFLAPVLGHALEKIRGGDRECGGGRK